GRFQREARSAAKLHHTNIVPVFGVGDQDGLHYYVMQFIQGLGLDVVLDELRRLRRPRGKAAPTNAVAPGAPGPRARRAPGLTPDVSVVAVARGLLSGEFRPPEPAADLTIPVAEASPVALAPASPGDPLAWVPRAPGDSGTSVRAADTSATIRL